MFILVRYENRSFVGALHINGFRTTTDPLYFRVFDSYEEAEDHRLTLSIDYATVSLEALDKIFTYALYDEDGYEEIVKESILDALDLADEAGLYVEMVRR